MPKFSSTSHTRLKSCHPDLQRVFYKVIQDIDIIIICGHRSEEDQERAYREGNSMAHFGESPHNKKPSMAVDVSLYHPDKPHIRWAETHEFYFLAGYVIALAKSMGIDIEWGGDWDKDYDFEEGGFIDLPHFQLAGWKNK